MVVAETPLNVTDVAPERCEPLIATHEPTLPAEGEKAVTAGGEGTRSEERRVGKECRL